MLTTLAEASCVLKRQDYLSAAVSGGSFLLGTMMHDGKLRHTFKDGQTGIDGFLDDYALTIEGFLSLNQVTLNVKWLQEAVRLTETLVRLFADSGTGLLYDTAAGIGNLIVRPRNNTDGALPAGNSAATLTLLKMAVLTGNRKYRELAERALDSVKGVMGMAPLGYSQWLCNLDFYLSAPREIVIAGPEDNPQTRELTNTVCTKWLPDKVMAVFDPAALESASDLSLLKNARMIDGRPAVYICQNYTCRPPVTDIIELRRQLEP